MLEGNSCAALILLMSILLTDCIIFVLFTFAQSSTLSVSSRHTQPVALQQGNSFSLFYSLAAMLDDPSPSQLLAK